MATLFISDLHLCSQRPAVTDLFIDFLHTEAVACEALYILGDLFEYWIGDEAVEQEEFRPMIEGLRSLTLSGVPVNVMHGNRDFLLGEQFAQASGCRLLNDPTITNLYGQQVMLMHGDTMCTDDHEYQDFRRMVRDPKVQQEFLRKSIEERDHIVRDYRQKSKLAAAQKKPEIMDVNQQAVENEMKKHNILHLIHGHTHRPGEHHFNLDGTTYRRMVLGDWYDQGSVLRCDASGWTLKKLPLSKTKRHASVGPVG